MPIKYKILKNRKFVYAVGEGQISFDDLLQHVNELAEDPKYVSPMKKLVDYRNATIANLTTEEANKFTDKKAQHIDIFRNEMCAIVTDKDLDFGMSRVHGAHIESSNIDTSVFRTIKDALLWLQVDIDEIEINFG